ncbi:MAG: porin [Planctomycetota bacterium]
MKALENQVQDLSDEVVALQGALEDNAVISDSWADRLYLGGYGELHANFTEGKSGDQFDIHRLVFYLGYEFTDWIRFNSETEIEHAYVTDDSDGELSIEQAHVDFMLNDALNIRFGRILTPLGIVNKKHEPPTFNGVERPSFAKYIIPTTWSSDGLGIYGNLTPSLKYEAYVVSGLDGTEFTDTSGIRNGRNKERPSLNEPAITGRLDYFPFAEHGGSPGQMLRVGLSAYAGGLDNGNKGNDPGLKARIRIYSADFEYSLNVLDFRGAFAYEDIDGAHKIGNGTAEKIMGWYIETGCHVWPDSWKEGKLANADAVVFARWDDFNTQYKMPSGQARNPEGDRKELTFGISFLPTPNLVIKADYQIRDDATAGGPPNLFNLGVGWQF